MITGLRNHAFHGICKKGNNKNFVKNIDIIYSILFLLIIVHGTYVFVWNVLLSKQSTIIKSPNEDEKRTRRSLAIIATVSSKPSRKKNIFFSKVFSEVLL